MVQVERGGGVPPPPAAEDARVSRSASGFARPAVPVGGAGAAVALRCPQ